MKYSKAAILAWFVCGIAILATVVGLAGQLASNDTPTSLLQWISVLAFAMIPVVSAVVGALIISQQPRNVIGWLVMLPAMAGLLDGVIRGHLSSVQTAPDSPSLTLILAVVISNSGWLLLIFPLIFIILLFPTGSPPSPRWRPVVWLGIALIVIFLGVGFLGKEIGPDPDTYGVDWNVPNPIGVLDSETVDAFFSTFWGVGLIGFTLLALASLIVRYRHSGTVEREQIKWVFYAAAVFGVIYGGILAAHGEAQGLLQELFDVALSVGALGLPIAIGISILRYRLFDIDVIIRRTLTYAFVTGLLLVVFFGSVIVLQQVFSTVTGSGQNEIVTVLSTLAIAALFVPLRNWVQHAIDRRFNRKRYDAQQVLSDFANTVRDETDLEKLTARLMQVVDETMQPKSVSVWLKNDGRPPTIRQHTAWDRDG